MSDQPQPEPTETPEAFLKKLSEQLTVGEGVDTDLAKVLTGHILVSSPAKDAVAKAKAAILNLAETRAAPPLKVEADNG